MVNIKVPPEEYQAFIATTWQRDENPLVNELRMWNGLQGETGEMAEVNKKFLRDKMTVDEFHDKMVKEMGDAMYYLITLASYYDITFDEVLRANVDKLSSRKARGVINGSGDDR